MATIIKEKIYGETILFKISKNSIDNKYWIWYLNTFLFSSWEFMKSFNTPKEARKYVREIEKEYNIVIGVKL